jgi:hypothetical protein
LRTFFLPVELFALHYADEARRHETAGKRRDIHQQENVDGVAICRECPGKKAEIVRKDHAFRENLAEGKDSLSRIVAVLVPVALRGFDDDLEGLIASWVERGGVGQGALLLFRHS